MIKEANNQLNDTKANQKILVKIKVKGFTEEFKSIRVKTMSQRPYGHAHDLGVRSTPRGIRFGIT